MAATTEEKYEVGLLGCSQSVSGMRWRERSVGRERGERDGRVFVEMCATASRGCREIY